jgi:hypothetical protein
MPGLARGKGTDEARRPCSLADSKLDSLPDHLCERDLLSIGNSTGCLEKLLVGHDSGSLHATIMP